MTLAEAAILEQADPLTTGSPSAIDQLLDGQLGFVISDSRIVRAILARQKVGEAKYNAVLTGDNGHDHLVDVAQELLDAMIYLAAWRQQQGVPPPLTVSDYDSSRIFDAGMANCQTSLKLIADRLGWLADCEKMRKDLENRRPATFSDLLMPSTGPIRAYVDNTGEDGF